MRALCFCVIMISYLAFFMYISNHMIFLQQFGINEHLLIFSRTTNCTHPTGSCNLLVLIYSKLFEIVWLPILICFSGLNKHHIDRRDYICLGQKQRKKIWEGLKILDILSIFTVPIISGGWLLIFNIVFNHQANLPVKEDYHVISNYQNNQTLLTNSALHKLRTHIHFTQLRFHCHKKNGSTFHIVTKTDEKGEAVIQYFTGQTETVPTSCGSFQKMEDDDSELAKNCSWWGKKNSTYRSDTWGIVGRRELYDVPMFIGGLHHWMTSPKGDRWECDDFHDPQHSQLQAPPTQGDFWKIFIRWTPTMHNQLHCTK